MILPVHRERRKDRRHHLTGQAVLTPVGRRGPTLYGGIVDVSATGMRLRVSPGADIDSSDRYELDLEVPLPNARETVPPLRLYGVGEVVRVDVVEEGATEAAIRFDAPLVVSESFAARAPALASPFVR